MVDLKMVTTHFDCSFRRLLANTTETNYIALALSYANDKPGVPSCIRSPLF